MLVHVSSLVKMTNFLVKGESEQKFELLDGKFAGVVYKYRTLSFSEDDTKAHFDYQLCYVPEGVEITKEFELEIFRILMQVIEESQNIAKTKCIQTT